MHAEERGWMADRSDSFDQAIERMLVVLLAFMPLAFGVVAAWSEEVVIAFAAVISITFAMKLILARKASLPWSWAYVPVLVFCLVALVQVAALPIGWVRLISPQTATHKIQLLNDIGLSGISLSPMQISFYPHATWHDLRLLLAAVAIFAVVLSVFRQSEQILRLLWAIAIIGAGVAVLALTQTAFGNDKIYWFVQSPHGVAFSGPFVNHSHYAQFMNLSVGAALAVIFAKLHQRFGGRSITVEKITEYAGTREGRRIGVLLLIVVLGAASVFVSLSRGGVISMMVAAVFLTLVVSSRISLKGSGWVIALLALGAFICVLYVGFDAVYDRLGTLQDLSRAEEGRWQIVKDIAVAWTKFPLLGTGLGTHEVVYPMFDRSTIPALATHAENEYAQAAEETGAAGIVALLVFGVVVWRNYVRAVRSPRAPIHSAAHGLGFGLLAIMVHSLSDFGQHLPANAFLSAVFCALLIRLPHIDPDTDVVPGEILLPPRQTRRFGAGGLAVAVVLFGVALCDADAARRAQACWAKVQRAEREMIEADWRAGDEAYVYLLQQAAQAQKHQPSNVHYRYWLNVYRWHAISRVDDPNAGDVSLSPQARAFAGRIVDELKQAVILCPVFGPAWSVAGQLEKSICGLEEEGIRHVCRGRQLAPCDPTTCMVSGMLYSEKNQIEAAFGEWRRAVELDGRMFMEASSLLIGLKRVDLARTLAGSDTTRLVGLEELLRESGDTQSLAEVSDSILELMEKECQESDAPAWKLIWLARKYHEDARLDRAIQLYQRALALEYNRVSWRFSLAQALNERGSVPEAVQELEICLRLQPEFEAAKTLLAAFTK